MQDVNFTNQDMSQNDLTPKLTVMEIEKDNGNGGKLDGEHRGLFLFAAPALSAPVECY